MADFGETGCPVCRSYWLGSRAVDVHRLGVSRLEQAAYVRCGACGQLWAEPNGNYPYGVTQLPPDLMN